MRPVPERPRLPTSFPATFGGVIDAFSNLISALVPVFSEHGFRLNRTLPKDGTEAMTGPLPLQSVAEADLPLASEHEGSVIYVSDGASGSRFRGSDGSSWVDLG